MRVPDDCFAAGGCVRSFASGAQSEVRSRRRNVVPKGFEDERDVDERQLVCHTNRVNVARRLRLRG